MKKYIRHAQRPSNGSECGESGKSGMLEEMKTTLFKGSPIPRNSQPVRCVCRVRYISRIGCARIPRQCGMTLFKGSPIPRNSQPVRASVVSVASVMYSANAG